jgi:probable rRNA maturation factor
MAQLFIENAHARYRIPRKETLTALRRVLKGEGSRCQWVNVVYIGDSKSRQLNRKYLAHNYATDVMAFRFDDGGALDGEIYVNLDRAKVQAREYGVPFRHEVMRLVIHGLLHLLGYRDSTAASRKKMVSKENKYLARIWTRTSDAGTNN